MKPFDKAYQEELERIEQRYEGVHEMVLCDQCKREFRAKDKKNRISEEYICPTCEEDLDI